MKSVLLVQKERIIKKVREAGWPKAISHRTSFGVLTPWFNHQGPPRAFLQDKRGKTIAEISGDRLLKLDLLEDAVDETIKSADINGD